MYILIGHSASGKSTIERLLCDTCGLQRIISYTTRPIRKLETQDEDYHFISNEEFENKLSKKFFCEYTKYNDWYYGIATEDCLNNRIVTVEPNGFRQLKKCDYLNITSFFILASERTRVIRMMKRGDNVMESFRRIISDQGSFNGIEREVDYVIENEDGDNNLNKAINKIYSYTIGGK